MDEIAKDESLNSILTDLISKTATHLEGSSSPQDFSLFLAIANAQRATLQEERERLRFVVSTNYSSMTQILYITHFKGLSYKKHASCLNKNADNIENFVALCKRITYNFPHPKSSR